MIPVAKTKRSEQKSRPKRKSTNSRKRSPRGKKGVHTPHSALVARTAKKPTLPKKKDDVFRIIPIGGFDETGARNCVAVEYKQDILLVDIGIMFPEEDMPGVDYIIPDVSLLRGRERDIRGVLLTHAHLDHIGAVPHIVPKIGNPPIFASSFTAKLLKRRYQDFPGFAEPIIQEISPGSILRVGRFEVEAFHEQHSVPDSLGLVIRTPEGSILFTGDWKFDPKPVHDKPTDHACINHIAKRGVTVMIGDSTNADKPGTTISETTVMETFEKIFKESKGRIITSTTGSNVRRLQQLISLAIKHGRKVAIEGFSMRTAVDIAQELKYINIPKGTIVTAEQTNNLPPHKVLILCTGAQAEDRAVLMRIVNKEHKYLKIQPGDSVIFSSSSIPGNERSIGHLKDYLARQGADVYHNQIVDVHSSGHGKQDDLKQMIRAVRPKYFVPAYGDFYHRKCHGKIAEEAGIPKTNILYPDNGQVVEIQQGGVNVNQKERYVIDYIMVDGLGVGDLEEIVLRDRQILSSDGIVLAIIKMSHRSGALVGKPEIVSRGFVYMKGQRKLIEEMEQEIRKIIQKTQSKGEQKSPPNEIYVKKRLRDDLGQFLFNKTQRRPMIIPVLLEV